MGEEADVTMTAEQDQQSAIGRKLAGKYLTFKLGDEEYGLEILKVQTIIQMQEVTKVPKTPHFVRGVINLRGKVIPVIDLRVKFGLETREDTDKTCIVVVQATREEQDATTMGIIIDEVNEVPQISAEDIEETPSFGSNVNTSFILGMAKLGGNVKILLDIDRVLSTSDIAAVEAAV
jgi:purine-binding chemotaxis protein CheW